MSEELLMERLKLLVRQRGPWMRGMVSFSELVREIAGVLRELGIETDCH